MKLPAWLSNNESYRFKKLKVEGKGTMSPFSIKLMDTIKISSTGISA